MMMRRRIMAALCAVAMVAVMPAATAAASSDTASCPVLASARGLQLTISQDDNLVLGKPAGPGVPVAQACVNYAITDSLSFASSPHPGDLVLALPGILRGRTQLPVPEYPAYAGARYPTNQESSVNEPGMKLLAASKKTASSAYAQNALDPENSGTGSTLSTADSSVDPAAGTAVATAKATVQPLTVGGVLTLGQVVSVASAKLSESGTVERSSRLAIGRTTVAGQEVVITPEGVRAAGQTAPLPDTTAVTDQLEQAGISVRYLKPEKTSHGVVSAGVEITMQAQDPGTGQATTLEYILGQSFAQAASAEGGGGGSFPIDLGVGSVGTPGSQPSGSGTSPEPAVAGPAPAGGVPAASGSAPVAASPAPEVAEPAGTRTPVALTGMPVDMGLTAAYMVIIFGAMAMFVSGTLVRLLGVKTRWTS